MVWKHPADVEGPALHRRKCIFIEGGKHQSSTIGRRYYDFGVRAERARVRFQVSDKELIELPVALFGICELVDIDGEFRDHRVDFSF